MSVASFYQRSRWGSRWGVVDKYHPTRHKGLDIINPGRTEIPALRGGVCVANAPSGSVGRYITIQVGPGDFDTYAHILYGPSIGQRVASGEATADDRRMSLSPPNTQTGRSPRGWTTQQCWSPLRPLTAAWRCVSRCPISRGLRRCSRSSATTANSPNPLPVSEPHRLVGLSSFSGGSP